MLEEDFDEILEKANNDNQLFENNSWHDTWSLNIPGDLFDSSLPYLRIDKSNPIELMRRKNKKALVKNKTSHVEDIEEHHNVTVQRSKFNIENFTLGPDATFVEFYDLIVTEVSVETTTKKMTKPKTTKKLKQGKLKRLQNPKAQSIKVRRLIADLQVDETVRKVDKTTKSTTIATTLRPKTTTKKFVTKSRKSSSFLSKLFGHSLHKRPDAHYEVDDRAHRNYYLVFPKYG